MTTRKTLFAALVLGLSLVGCKEPQTAVRSAHTVLIYSRQYDINLLGLEKQYGFDVGKPAKIHDELIEKGMATEQDFLAPEPVTDEQLLLVHPAKYLEQAQDPKELAAIMRYRAIANVPALLLRTNVLEPVRYQCGGTILACRQALKQGVAVNLGGGYHHAHAKRGGGFCIYADVAVAIRLLQKNGEVRRVLIVDLDLHQGDGNATIFETDDSVYTFSMHEENIYPFPKATSDLDIPLEGGTGDEEYMKLLRAALPGLIERNKPDLIVYVAGSDLYHEDPLGSLSISAQGIVQRDLYVLDTAVRQGVPVALVLAGGYTESSWRLHYNSIEKILERYPLPRR